MVDRILGEKLREAGLNTGVCATDEFSPGKAVGLYNTLDDAAKSHIAAISSHSYWGSLTERYAFRDLAASEGKPAVMSETCQRGGEVHDHASMLAALETAWHITTDIRDMGSNVWLWFEPVTDEEIAVKYPSNWGAIHASYQGPDAQRYWVTKTFFGIAQYSRLIGPGDIIIHNTDPYVLSAYNPSTGKLVLAVYNAAKSGADYTFDLAKFTDLKTNKVAGYRTSAGQDMERLPSIDIDNARFRDRIPAESITTYLVDGARYSGPLHKNINDNVRGTGQGQIEYGGSWNYSSEKTQVAEWCHVLEARDYYKGYGEGLYSKDCHWSETAGDWFQIRFTGRQVRVYGVTDVNHGSISVRLDGGEETVVDCYSKSKKYQVLLYTSALLPEGRHILKVQVAERKNKASTGHAVSVDKIQITGGTWRR